MDLFTFLKKRGNKTAVEKLDLRQMKIPILILDKTWHDMFHDGLKTPKIIALEKKLGTLLKEQGRLHIDHKDYGTLKKDLLDNILQLTTEAFDNQNEEAKKEMERSQKYVLDINEKFQQISKKKDHVENEITRANHELFQESVKICYEIMKESQSSLTVLTDQVEKLRSLLRHKIDEKNIQQQRYDTTYLYLHKIIGANNINILDDAYAEDQQP